VRESDPIVDGAKLVTQSDTRSRLETIKSMPKEKKGRLAEQKEKKATLTVVDVPNQRGEQTV
jgi:hypothetical protein